MRKMMLILSMALALGLTGCGEKEDREFEPFTECTFYLPQETIVRTDITQVSYKQGGVTYVWFVGQENKTIYQNVPISCQYLEELEEN